MKKNRRDFLKITGLTGIGLTNLSLIPGYGSDSDFTCGAYKTNTPVDINLLKGGNTGVRTSFLNKESV